MSLYHNYDDAFLVSIFFYFSQMQQLEESQAVQLEDVDQVTNEFTKRLSESERLCQQAIRVSHIFLCIDKSA